MMSIINISLKALGLATLLASSSVYATNITVGGSTVIVDDRESAGDRDAYGRDSIYNIDQMNVSWSADNTITVDIFTNFANFVHDGDTETHNNQHEYYGKDIVYGDLLIGVDNGSSYNYAFNLGDMRWDQGAVSPTNSSGGLYAINGLYTSQGYHRDRNGQASRQGAIAGATTGSELGSNTSWGVSQGVNQWGVSQGKISFSFNVAGLGVFTSAQSLALSWAESCFNDDVSQTLNVRRNRPVTSVPEPTTALLMLLALGGLVYRRRSKGENFSA